MNEKELIEYYNKFNEDKRLTRRHGKVEFIVTLKYIHDYLNKMNNPKIIDIIAIILFCFINIFSICLFLNPKTFNVANWYCFSV